MEEDKKCENCEHWDPLNGCCAPVDATCLVILEQSSQV